MADEQKPKKEGKKSKKPEAQDDALTATAKAIGSAAGKIATLAGVAEPAPAREPKKSLKPPKKPKLQKKNNPHLPRKLKKAQKKAADAKAKA
jgi:hypothetical protein